MCVAAVACPLVSVCVHSHMCIPICMSLARGCFSYVQYCCCSTKILNQGENEEYKKYIYIQRQVYNNSVRIVGCVEVFHLNALQTIFVCVYAHVNILLTRLYGKHTYISEDEGFVIRDCYVFYAYLYIENI